MKSFHGKTIVLRPVEISDYEFIHSLRVAPKSTKFLSIVDDDPLQQKRWLEQYKKREDAGEECYFLIQRVDNAQSVGSLRAYNIDNEKKTAQCGSWILNENKTMTSAVESILLLCEVMDELGMKKVIVDARKDHAMALRFIKKISQRFHSEDATNFYYEIDMPVIMTEFYKDNHHYIERDIAQA
ncbi:GNAT family N-acetyltransferase [Rouxiella badensis]|uniref:GNAT family N-acetyltransferase n=1 Tax=Rouxiella badensis TaxID=1646377 RepID=UPI001D1502E1|nr:GNAT family N-acetyltransferase [Rouxiella badensis]MCC3703453.1 GNAT family N-acetyltransferase [Rouxiella badensis]MCC3731876.1 GNAT family N-acetyltransferase [Rouxiella badensis]MCC3757265.1 GNAT family N-acetyltransferase [Rouxiella badensis]